MISAILSFFGGTAFRMLWGEASSLFNKWQDHKFELQRLRLQADLDAEKHKRDLESIRLQAELQVEVVRVAAEGEVSKTEASAFLEAVKGTTAHTGIWLVDLWNAVIRPAGATWALAMLSANEFAWLATALSEDTRMVCFAFIGLFVADRTLGKRGK